MKDVHVVAASIDNHQWESVVRVRIGGEGSPLAQVGTS